MFLSEEDRREIVSLALSLPGILDLTYRTADYGMMPCFAGGCDVTVGNTIYRLQGYPPVVGSDGRISRKGRIEIISVRQVKGKGE